MGAIKDQANSVYRDFVVDGVPASGQNDPAKSDIRDLFSAVDIGIAAAQAGIKIVATTADRDTYYATPANREKLVYVNNNNGSATDPANGVYEYVNGAPRIAQAFYQGVAAVVQPLVDEAEDARDQAVAILPLLPTKMGPDSGYSYALVDPNNRAALLIRDDGHVTIPVLSVRNSSGTYSDVSALFSAVPQAIAGPDSGVAYALVDQNGRAAFVVKSDGSTTARISSDAVRWRRPDDQAQYPALGSPDMVAWGDSLSEVGSGGDWQGKLAALYPGRSVEPRGIGGQVSTMIAARADAIVTTVTVSGGQLASSGSTALSSVTPDLLAHVTDQSIEAAIIVDGQAIRGTLHRAPNGAYDFTRTLPGAAVTVPADSRLRPLIAPLDQRIALVRVGQNDIGTGIANAQALVLANSAAIVRRLVSQQRRFLVVGLHMGGGETAGSGSRVAKEAVNAEWKRLYGDRFVDINWFLINRGLAAAGVTPTAQDNTDISNGIVPSSLRSDQIHFSQAGGTANSIGLSEALERNGY